MSRKIESGLSLAQRGPWVSGSVRCFGASNTCSKSVLLSASPKNSADSSTPGRSEDVSDGL
jgi:hypothetical protein